MTILVSHKIRIKPNKKHQAFLFRCCGVARFVYNYGLANWKQSLELKEKTSWMKIDKKLNLVKETEYPWMYEVPSCIGQHALINLGQGISNFFKKTAKFPVFKKKGYHDSFSITNIVGKIKGNKLQLSKHVSIKMYEKLRFTGKIMSYVISRQADQWFVAITVEVEDFENLPSNENQVGIDLGIKTFATMSDGSVIENPNFLRSNLKSLKRLGNILSRKVKGSNNRFKAKRKLARKHQKISNQRKDFLHRITTNIIRKYDVIKIEDLNVAGMMKNHNLALAISEVGFFEFKRQLLYKTQWYGKTIKLVNRWFPSSKTCSKCGCIKEELKLSERIYECEHCGFSLDRDINAAINICNVPI